MTVKRARILRPCIECGRRSPDSRCPRHRIEHEVNRQARQPYRAAYSSPEYKEARVRRIRRARGRCEFRDEESRRRCAWPAQETHHVIPLSTAKSYEEALALCNEENLRAVCWRHNPRGQGQI